MSILFLNGNFIEDTSPFISHKDCGFTTGIGIFDSMLAKDGAPIYAQEHFERIVHDTKTITGLTLPINFEKFQAHCLTLLQKNKLTHGYARIRTTVTGGIVKSPLAAAHTPTILIDVAQASNPEEIKPALCAIITDFPRIAGCALENCKRLDYSRSYAARRKAETLGAAEAIHINTEGNIACGATSNIFIEENGVLITPPLSDGVLAGVTRRKILEKQQSPHLNPPPFSRVEDFSTTHIPSTLFKGGGLGRGDSADWKDIIEQSISPARLHAADKIFLTNSFIGLRPVKIIDK